jgi:hypothetical protein
LIDFNLLETQKNLEELGLEDGERPVWEDVDTNKVIEDIKNKKIDFLSNLPQEKGFIFGEKVELVHQEPVTLPKTLLNRFKPQPVVEAPVEKPEQPTNLGGSDFGGLDFAEILKMDQKPIYKKEGDDFFEEQDDIFKAALSQFSNAKTPEPVNDDGSINYFINSLNMGAPPSTILGKGRENVPTNQNPQMPQMQQIQQMQQLQQM